MGRWWRLLALGLIVCLLASCSAAPATTSTPDVRTASPATAPALTAPSSTVGASPTVTPRPTLGASLEAPPRPDAATCDQLQRDDRVAARGRPSSPPLPVAPGHAPRAPGGG